MEPLADHDHGEQRREYGHEMREHAGLQRAHPRDAESKQHRRDERRQRREVQDAQRGTRRQRRSALHRDLRGGERKQEQQAQPRRDEQKRRQRQRRRPLGELDRVERPQRHGGEQQQVGRREAKREHGGRISAREDRQDAQRRDREPGRFEPRRTPPVEQHQHGDDHHRDGRVEQAERGGCRAGEANVREAGLRPEAHQCQQRERAKPRTDRMQHRGPFAPDDRQQDRDDDEPAQARQRDGGQRVEEAARRHGAAGPQGCRQHEGGVRDAARLVGHGSDRRW